MDIVASCETIDYSNIVHSNLSPFTNNINTNHTYAMAGSNRDLITCRTFLSLIFYEIEWIQKDMIYLNLNKIKNFININQSLFTN